MFDFPSFTSMDSQFLTYRTNHRTYTGRGIMRGYLIDILCTAIVVILLFSVILYSKNRFAQLVSFQSKQKCRYLSEEIALELMDKILEKNETLVTESGYVCHWENARRILCKYPEKAYSNITAHSALLAYDNGKMKMIHIYVVCKLEE